MKSYLKFICTSAISLFVITPNATLMAASLFKQKNDANQAGFHVKNFSKNQIPLSWEKVQTASEQSPTIDVELGSADQVCLDPKYAIFNDHLGHSKSLLLFKKFPAEQDIIFSIKRLVRADVDHYKEQCRLYCQKDGSLFLNGNQTASYFCIESRGFLPGERIYCRFQTKSGNPTQEISFIPNQMIASNPSKKITLEAELITIDPTMYAIKLAGMKNGESFKFRSISGHEVIEKTINYQSGNSFNILPGVLGLDGGLEELQILTESNETIILHLPWGNELLNYLKGNKIYSP